MRMISSLEWCWEVKQGEDGIVFIFDHMGDVESLDKGFVQDRGHIGVEDRMEGEELNRVNVYNFYPPVMEIEKLAIDGEGAYG